MMSFKRVAAILAVAATASTVMVSIAEAQNRRGPLRVTDASEWRNAEASPPR